MIVSDFTTFSAAWSRCSELQAGQPVKDTVISFAFDLLQDYELFEITEAMTTHCRKSPWMPRPAEIRAIVEGSVPAPDVLVELAYAGTTILGKFVRSLLGGDLQTMHPKQAVTRVTSRLVTIEQFYRRALKGEFTEDELRMLLTAEINPQSRIAPNCPRVRQPYRVELGRRIAATTLPAQIEETTEPRTDAELKAGREQLAKLMGGMGIGSVKP